MLKEIMMVISAIFSAAVAIVGLCVLLNYIGKHIPIINDFDDDDDIVTNIGNGLVVIMSAAMIGLVLFVVGRFIILPVFGLV